MSQSQSNQPVSELTITIKNEEKKQITNHLIYEIYSTSPSDPIIDNLIQDAIKQFKDNPDSIRVRINIEIQ